MMIPEHPQPPSTPAPPPHVGTGSRPEFPLRPARACACCGTPLGTGYGHEVPLFGVLGPRCVQKFAPLLAALNRAQQLRAVNDGSAAWRAACLTCLRLRGLGFEVTAVHHADGSQGFVVGRLTRPAGAVVKSWRAVRDEFEERLRLAGTQGQVS
ncbi:hypothetical protein [Deinococcus rufus]|uniref:Uncharacterized protein n=1 Tax=Deinococcus rufus TaxID=2136097 RepID=A0ABV7ZBI0_9DEIO